MSKLNKLFNPSRKRLLSPFEISGGVIIGNKPANIAEGYERVSVHLLHALETKSSRIVVTTGVRNYKDYSYLTTTNLAVSLAATGNSVVLLDADFRTPSIHALLSLENRQGVVNICNGVVKWEDVVVREVSANLDFIPAGSIPESVSSVLNCDCMQNLLEVLSKHYDIVLIHTPPVNIFSDALKLIKRATGIVLTVERHKTKNKTLLDTIDEIKLLRGEVLGVLITSNIPEKKLKKMTEAEIKKLVNQKPSVDLK